MANQLHILNGDATVPEFRKSGIPGKIVVWREVLCEGPVKGPIQEDLFWEQRAAYIQDKFGGEHYKEKMIAELDKIRNLSSYDEVVLWFEYDLFCQVNLLACLNFIDHEKICLVCLGDELDGQLRGLGEIAANDFITLFESRLPLSKDDLAYAKAAWQAYTSDTPEQLSVFSSSDTFKHFKPAIAAHLTRLPGKNGLNQVEEKMLLLIKEGINNDRKLVGTLLRDQGYFGLGDLQYFQYLDQLRPLLKEEALELNELGINCLEGLAVFPQPDQYIAGVFRPSYFEKTWQ
ncbi:MAG: hypothetical protein R8G66_29815 [Cytophagales bacterium]|nr:hypothetical protein [Cytophagales bacterium]